MVPQKTKQALPSRQESVAFIHSLKKPTVASQLQKARLSGKPLFQPRCGVGGHTQMKKLLWDLEDGGRADILTLTIDAHTRLRHFEMAGRLLEENPKALNGYPLVSHGWQKGRELNTLVQAPLQVRHGSPDPTELFAETIASGITSFEGGGISYNLPYSKDVPLEDSLQAWQGVDQECGQLAAEGVVVDRELFGTLTAVLVPPSISLAISFLEALLAVEAGVKCISIAYPQTGAGFQDVAALRAISSLARKYLPHDVAVHPVFHEFMGAFPRDRSLANAIILYGALIGKTGGATKVITKTYDEAFGIPTTQANVEGLRLARASYSFVFDTFAVDESRCEEEQAWIEREVDEILSPILESTRLIPAIVQGFGNGTLDIPFSASRYAKSEILPLRDSSGAIRYHAWGNLALGDATSKRNQRLLDGEDNQQSIVHRMMDSIHFFSSKGVAHA